ncbi:MAG: MCP four helix bundle domain-containing protein, partial [Burkholderiaceae bacterium]
MTIAQRLYALIFSAALGLAGLAGLGIYQMDKVYTATNYANVNTVPSLLVLDGAINSLTQLRVELWQHIALNDPAKKTELNSKMNAVHAKLIDALNKYEKDEISDDKDRGLLAADRSVLAEYDALRQKVLMLSNVDKDQEAADLLLANQALLNNLVNAFDTHRQYNAELGQKSTEIATATKTSANWMSIIIALVVVAVITGMGLLITRKIIKALNVAVTIAQTVAAGDLTSNIEVTTK